MPFVAQGAATQLDETYVLVRATPSGPLVDPDAGTLTLVINDPDGDPILSLTEGQITRVSLGRFAYSWQTAVDQALGPYAFVWDAEINAVNVPDGVDEVEVIPAGTLTTGVITPADVRALLTTSLTDEQLEAVIVREEAELAAAIGPLMSERTDLFILTSNHASSRLTIRRPTDALALVVDNGDVVPLGDIRILADQRTLLRLDADGGWTYGAWVGPVEVTYTPNDLERVRRVLIELVGIGINAAGSTVTGNIVSETTGTYSYTLGKTAQASYTPEQRRRALVASLLPKQKPTSIRLRSSIIGRRSLLGTVRPT